MGGDSNIFFKLLLIIATGIYFQGCGFRANLDYEAVPVDYNDGFSPDNLEPDFSDHSSDSDSSSTSGNSGSNGGFIIDGSPYSNNQNSGQNPSQPTMSPPSSGMSLVEAARVRCTDSEAMIQAASATILNNLRARGFNCRSQTMGDSPAQALQWNGSLEQAAQVHGLDLGMNNITGHTGSDGSNASARMRAAGWRGVWYGEAIAYGDVYVGDTFERYKRSYTHCSVMMNPRFTHMGLGVLLCAGIKPATVLGFGSREKNNPLFFLISFFTHGSTISIWNMPLLFPFEYALISSLSFGAKRRISSRDLPALT